MKNTILSICFQGNYKAVFHTGGVLSESVRLIQLRDGPLKSDGEVGKNLKNFACWVYANAKKEIPIRGQEKFLQEGVPGKNNYASKISLPTPVSF